MSPQEWNDALPDMLHYQARNILEYHQAHGTKSPDAFAIFDVGQFEKDLMSVINFIRSKPIYASTPIGLFDPNMIVATAPIRDSKIRFFIHQGSVSLAILNFLSALQVAPNVESILGNQVIETEFKKALNKSLGKDANLSATAATVDETRLPFIAQKTDEISTNLLWTKLSARILEDGSDLFSSGFKDLSETEYITACDNILKVVLGDFKKYMLDDLSNAGALLFLTSEALSPQDKVTFMKNPKVQALIFQNSSVKILLEIIRYI